MRKQKIYQSFILFLFLFLLIQFKNYSQNQNPNNLNLNNTNTTLPLPQIPKNLSPEEMTINQLNDLGSSNQLNQSQIISLGRMRGLTDDQIKGVLKKNTKTSSSKISPGSLRNIKIEEGMGIFKDEDKLLDELLLTKFEDKLFGFSFFYNRELDFQPNFNMPTPKDYIVGPGDELLIQVYGTSQEEYNLMINPEGKINIPLVGPIHVSGFTISLIKEKINNALSKIYSGIKKNPPTVFSEVTISNIRTIKINLVGEVHKPGTYALPSFSNVFNALYAAGGPTKKGTFRAIKIYRGNKLLTKVDLYDFLLNGKNSATFSLTDNDIILVDTYTKHIEIGGNVKRPAIFELNGEKSIQKLINYAGGFSKNAYSKTVTVERLASDNNFVKDIPIDNNNFQFEDGDRIIVKEKVDLISNKLQIEGSVRVPGIFEWYEGITYEDLLKKAEGLLDDAYIDGITLFRQNADFRLETASILLQEKIKNKDNIFLQPEDLIYVPSVFNFEDIRKIQVSGNVYIPSNLPFYENMTLLDAIVLSGGLKNSALKGKIEIIRKENFNSKNFEIIDVIIPEDFSTISSDELKIKLNPFDHIYVRARPGYTEEKKIYVRGEVNYPGEYLLATPNMKLKDLINNAGGLTAEAYTDGAYLERLNKLLPKDNMKSELEALEEIQYFLASNKELNSSMNLNQKKILQKRVDYLKTKIEYNHFKKEKSEILKDSLEKLSVKNEKIAISLERIILNEEQDITLQEGDILIVPKTPEIIRLSGEVLKPTITSYEKNQNFKSYINQAGGVTVNAKKGKSFIIYPNGKTKRVKTFLFVRVWPKVKPGSEIIVPGGKVRTPFNIERFLALTTSLLTTYVIIQNTFK